jgi:hypothetical protein
MIPLHEFSEAEKNYDIIAIINLIISVCLKIKNVCEYELPTGFKPANE